MIAGIVLLALGVKKTITLMGSEPLDLWGQIKLLAAIALAGGAALYLVGHLLFRRRLDHSWSRPRAVAAGACVVLAAAAQAMPTLLLLAAVVGVLVLLVNHEHRRMGWLSHHLRHHDRDHGAAATPQ
jgi:hypothetical protein